MIMNVWNIGDFPVELEKAISFLIEIAFSIPATNV